MAGSALHVAILAAVLLAPFVGVPAEAQVAQVKKYCISQFAIASQACAILPPTSPEHRHHHSKDDDDDDEDEDDDDKGDDDDDDDKGGDDDDDKGAGGGGGGPPPSTITVGTEVANAAVHRNGTSRSNPTRVHRRRRRRRRRHRVREGDDEGDDDDDKDDEDEDEDEDDDDRDDDDDDDDDDRDDEHRAHRDCCRWLKEVEPGCVCEALLRLPSFLFKPQHKYTVRVGKSCKITYRCGGV